MAVNLIIIGAGGHARSTIDVIESGSEYQIECLYDPIGESERALFGYPVYPGSTSLPELIRRRSCELFVAVGDNFHRQRIHQELSSTIESARFATLLHQRASISPRASIGGGSVVMAGAVVNAGCTLDAGVIVNTNACVDHDCQIDSFASLAPGAVLGGNVHIGTRTSIGLGAKLIHNVSVSNDVVVGAGSLVLKNIEHESTVIYGQPARSIRRRAVDEPYL
jgi:sugar O-acyltransferase (sialic acid O-acetyltransferase NeuD family)